MNFKIKKIVKKPDKILEILKLTDLEISSPPTNTQLESLRKWIISQKTHVNLSSETLKK